MLSPLLSGDVAGWPLLGDLGKEMGDWIKSLVEAPRIANVVTETFPVEGQNALRPVEELVARCAETLGVEKPAVHVRNSPLALAYVVRAYDRDHLVLTSALLNLYEGRPDELAFVIGHELGHVKCDHIGLKNKAFGLLAVIRGINVSVVPDRYQSVLPALALGRLYTWCRESEVSADRAGLLCCGEPRAAYQAVMRLLHGLRPDSRWIDPEKEEFDPKKVIQEFEQWQYRPFVKLLVDLQRHTMEAPFIPERLAALKVWADTGAHREILARRSGSRGGQFIEVTRIRAYELAPEGQTVCPYVVVYDGVEQVLRTRTGRRLRAGEWKGFKSSDRGVNQPRAFQDGQPLFFEVWDSGYLSDALVGGFVVYPDSRDSATSPAGERTAEYTTRILWDWKVPGSVARSGFARVTVRFSERQSAAADSTAKGVK
jgi:Zn-dependent protease with chaperone function